MNDFAWLYTRCVEDNKEDFETLYWITWKFASVLLEKGVFTQDEYKRILKIQNKEEREKELGEMKNDIENN